MHLLRYGAIFTFLALPASTAFATQASESRERFHAAIQACAGQLGLPPPKPGDKPPRLSEEQRAELGSCLERQGVSLADLPPPPGPGMEKHLQKMKACLDAKGVVMPKPDFAAGPPELSEEQERALDDCQQQLQGAGI